MRLRCRTALIALVLSGAAATTAAPCHCDRVTRFRVQGARRGRRLPAQRFRSISSGRKPGEGYGLDYSQPGWKLDVFIYDLKRNAIPDDAKSAIVRAEFERSREDVFLAQPRGLYAQVYLRRNFTIEDPGQAHALPVRRVPPDPRRRQAAGRLPLRDLLEQQVHQVPHDHAERPRQRADRAQHMAAWIPVLWSGTNAKAEQKPEPRAQRRRPPPAAASASSGTLPRGLYLPLA